MTGHGRELRQPGGDHRLTSGTYAPFVPFAVFTGGFMVEDPGVGEDLGAYRVPDPP
jgi:hypothetical protein